MEPENKSKLKKNQIKLILFEPEVIKCWTVKDVPVPAWQKLKQKCV